MKLPLCFLIVLFCLVFTNFHVEGSLLAKSRLVIGDSAELSASSAGSDQLTVSSSLAIFTGDVKLSTGQLQLPGYKSGTGNAFAGDDGSILKTDANGGVYAGPSCLVGSVILWSGSLSDIPAGWAPCDGQVSNGVTTPDLRDRFVVGAGSIHTKGTQGGSSSVSLEKKHLPSHSHDITHSHTGGTTSSDGNHQHSTAINDAVPDNEVYNAGGVNAVSGSGQIGTPTSLDGSHSHSFSVSTHYGQSGFVGSGEALDLRPPWYALIYMICVGN